jgi:hypothetical protein
MDIRTLGKKASDRKAGASYSVEARIYLVIGYNPTP